MRKKIIYSIIGICTCAYTYAQSFCHLVQPVGTYYEDTIESPGTYYFSAETFDLPMDVMFTSLDPNCSEAPQLWADLTCTPGVYSNPDIQALVKDTVKYHVSVPMSIKCQTDTVDGHYVHHLKLGKSYRNKLKLVGVNYSVPAYVKVILPCAGVAHMEQDTSSQSCINDARRIALPDSARVLANDSLSTYILLYKDWLAQADSVALCWDGPEPARVWVEGYNCEFETDAQHVWDWYDIPARGEYHISKSKLTRAINSGTPDSTGLLFAKIVSAEEGRIHTRPLKPDFQDAVLFHLNTPQEVKASGNDFYCFPTEWTNVEWIANTRKVVKMYLHTSPDQAAIDSFEFDLQDDTRRVLNWSTQEMKQITAKITSPLLFVRFACSREEFVVTPYTLDPSSCAYSAIRIRPGTTYAINSNKKLCLYYSDIEGYPLEISCVNNDATDLQNLFIADTCEFKLNWRTNATKKRCVLYKQTAKGGETWTISSEDIAGWKTKLTPPDGFYYVRGAAEGTITITTTKPEEQDPEGEDPEYPEIPTGMDNSSPERDYQKILHNGQIFIIRAGKTYTITGQVVKIE